MPSHIGLYPNNDERRLAAAEMWFYRRMLRISWTEKGTNKSILDELQTRRERRSQIMKRKWLSLDMHAETISVNYSRNDAGKRRHQEVDKGILGRKRKSD